MEFESCVSHIDFHNLIVEYVPTTVVGHSYQSLVVSAVDRYTRRDYSECVSVSQSALDYTWERLNIGNWKDVNISWRYAYTIASVVKVISEYNLLIGGDPSMTFDTVMKSCDMGLLMGAPLCDNTLTTISTSLQKDFRNRSMIVNLDVKHCSRKTTDLKSISAANVDSSDNNQGDIVPITGKVELLQSSECASIDNSSPTDTNIIDVKTVYYCSCTDVHTDSDNAHGNEDDIPHKKQKVCYCSAESIDMSKSVERCSCPSLETFQRDFMAWQKPVIITDAMSFWPALSTRMWTLDYIKETAGYRTVPIEMGSKYTDDSWSQSLMTMREFIEKHIERETSLAEVGYLAQHQLFNQIPELEEDIITPDYCYLGTSDECVDINAWFGPKGTVSPMHYDPKHNFLAQIMGEKYIRLYHENETENLYPHDTTILKNTSQVDVESPDSVTFPMFQKAAYTECVLKSGEMLYLPPRYWHFVKSLSISFSVSFWWE